MLLFGGLVDKRHQPLRYKNINQKSKKYEKNDEKQKFLEEGKVE